MQEPRILEKYLKPNTKLSETYDAREKENAHDLSKMKIEEE